MNDGSVIYDLWKKSKNESIKWYTYFPKYEQHFSHLKNKEINFLEIGVRGGGSLEVWRKFFPNAKNIIGLDIDSSCKQYESQKDNIFVEIGSQDNEEVLDNLINKYKNFDIILDDGGHRPELHEKTFNHLFKHLNENGVYCIEDLHTIFLEDFNKDNKQSILEELLPKILKGNFEWQTSMHLYRSIAFINKIKPEPPHWFGMQVNVQNPAKF